jgi:excisionase family DNA binding protein
MNGTLTTQEAARLLKVETRTLRRMVRRGLIRPVAQGAANRLRFHLSDIAAASRIRNARIELHHVASVAHQALALAELTEHRLNELYTLLGIGYAPLPTDTTSVTRLYQEAERLLEVEEPELSVEEVQRWARLFLAMTPAFLRLTEEALGQPEIWQTFVTLAEKLCEQAPRGLFNFHKDLESAYGFLEAGRRNAFSCAFFFVRNRHGHHAALELFPDRRKTLNEAVLAFLPQV